MVDSIKIPCLSLWQPWASLIAVGAKKIETRHWATNYRGPIAIHAAKRIRKMEMRDLDCFKSFRDALSVLRPDDRAQMWDYLPFGAIVAVADLTNCVPTFVRGALGCARLSDSISEQEHDFGDYSPDRFGWMLRNVRALDTPIEWRGEQGLFSVTLPATVLTPDKHDRGGDAK